MRVATWNVNSIRLRLETLKRVVGALEPDCLCIQEIKVRTEHFPSEDVAAAGFPHQLVRGMKGYNGVAILSRSPLTENASRDWCAREDARHVAALLAEKTELHNFYVPAGGDIPDPDVNEKFAHKLDFVAEATEWSAGAGCACALPCPLATGLARA